jgi:putative colanic acid biosynthesis UDP-glucose lipid carrier transferase
MQQSAGLSFVSDSADVVAPLHDVHATGAYQYRIVPYPVGGLAKRLFDIAAAAVGLLMLSPALLTIAFLIQLESPGPALFRQHRTGFRGRSFQVLKFRTMRTMEDGTRITQARPNDPRVTPFGKFLRRTSIDELPQLMNVLAGDMSLVGPRPHAVSHDRAFFLVDRHYVLRFVARPGITGVAQINGARGVTETPEQIERRLDYDLDYVSRWSMRRDIGILCLTARVLFGDKHAC